MPGVLAFEAAAPLATGCAVLSDRVAGELGISTGGFVVDVVFRLGSLGAAVSSAELDLARGSV
ncbi:hypothetical protein GTA62_09800 [Roseobacter sp. HKCCD9010]|uniref:hypothetical protein n=1 Tax=unclassified Roseobacter TaxID=196798 RepID=UPI001492CF65|nr:MULTISPECIES: hypothetical protein [unclassified Roseobacter]NNV26656.1 hypothetical protein [Roseobacter sp. HKCCD8192]NNV34732.1 hypothetical protein [Roseobacter sp. HKCCD9073]NNV42938.1 hypothetical protein [Roseobacter sp. HKCCD6497]NNV69232.1 hypothetical protein [Roseobacter sp. HKCCD8474]NNV81226.1 hypothetical protein [Roseobacter sp. HKCCD6547]NNW16047.1 hypothetical protein [Roseobacter sp. HKCCD8832]NNW20303.1 hypothetical protein [Roseobacter sp. HKCCD7543]NNW75713.1 hypothe